MKHIKIALIIFAALIAVSFGGYIIVNQYQEKKENNESSAQAELELFSFNSNDCTKIKIHNEEGDYIVEYADSQWKLTNSNEFKVNDLLMNTMCSYMSSLKAVKSIESTDDSKYGFDDPIEVTITENDNEHTIIVGDPTPTYENYYVKKKDSDKIYLIDYTYGSIFCADKNSLKSTTVLNCSISDIISFSVYDGEDIRYSVSLDQDENNWVMDKPFKTNDIFSSDVSEFISDALNLKIYSFVEENVTDYSKYGFDKPQFIVELGTSDENIKILLGDYLKNDTEIYGLFEETKQAVTFSSSDFPILGYELTDIIQPIVYKESTDNVSDVNLDLNGTKIEMGIDTEKENYTLNGKVIKGEELIEQYMTFYNSFTSAKFESYDPKQSPNGEAEVIVNYSLKDGSNVKIEYIPIPGGDENTYWAIKNGEYTGFIVRKKVVNYFTTSYEALTQAISDAT